MNITCPFCDSNKVEKIKITEIIKIPFCEDVVISHPTFRCNSCEEEGDFDNSLDKALTIAIDKANNMSAPTLMERLTHNGITMTYLEKALRLPFRTTSRWKRGKISHSALALLRLICVSPRLLEVADDNFSPEAITTYQISHPWDFFKKNTTNPCCSLTYDQNQIDLNFSGNHYLSVPPSNVQEVKWVTEKC
ncbi:MAG: hypothetical protein Q7U88_09310 [Desulfocapsaceae bacterium]|nr:hypothetical protein [Desulfocapsaceae bacterium]